MNIKRKKNSRIGVMGNKNSNLAPNGIASNLSSSSWNLVRSESFKNWFGDWEVDSDLSCLDKNGEPIVLHHGGFGIKNAEEFSDIYVGDNTGNNASGAFHFVDNLDIARDYGRQSFIRRFQDFPEGLVSDNLATEEEIEKNDIYEFVEELAESHIEYQSVFLKINNPMIIDMHGETVDVLLLERLKSGIKEKIMIEEMYDYIQEEFYGGDIDNFEEEIDEYILETFDCERKDAEEYELQEAIREILVEKGCEPKYIFPDGIIIKNMVDDISDKSKIIANQYIVFNNEQIGFRVC